MTGYTVHVGSSDDFADGWDRIFGDQPDEPKKKKDKKKKAAKAKDKGKKKKKK